VLFPSLIILLISIGKNMGPKLRGYKKAVDKSLVKDYRLFAVSCEGGKRENYYFKLFERLTKRVKIDIIEEEEELTQAHQTKSAPKWVFDRALRYSKSFGISSNDSLWLVIDVDRWKVEDIMQLFEYVKKKKNWNLIISNPCFEVWLYLHFKNDFDDLTPKQLGNLKETVSSLNQFGYKAELFVKNIDHAIENSESIDDHSQFPIPKKYCSKLHLLFNEMKKITPIKDWSFFLENIDK